VTVVDVVLVVGYFRSATAFLSIIKQLSPGHRIAVIQANNNPVLKRKTGFVDDLFMQLCVHFGAHLIDDDKPIRTKLLIVQQFIYSDEVAAAINAQVTADARIGLMTLAMAGIEIHDRFLAQFDICKVYVPSRRFMSFLLQRRCAEARYQGVEVLQVGLPYAQCRLFPDFTADYLIVAPTIFSFRSEGGKQHFLRTVLKLLSQISATDTVAYKPHNGQVLDYFTPRLHYFFGRIFQRVPGAVNLLELAIRRCSGSVQNHLNRVLTSILHLQLLQRVRRMNELTPYSGLAVEAFLPGVRKGVIGGLSNTTWGALYFKLDYYNCVDQAIWKNTPLSKGFKDAAGLLALNLDYFGVPYCEGRLEPPGDQHKIVTDADRQGDLISQVVTDLAETNA
jgi:hypothetical protein